jgi:D-sedoheptulose 7-phosphate isomerase
MLPKDSYNLSMTINVQNLTGEIEVKISAAKSLFSSSDAFDASRIANLAADILNGLKNGHRVAFVGNGGSAAEAMHLAAEFTGKCVIDHYPLPVMCLNESQSALTAIANDYGIEHMFSRMVKAHLRAGDYLIALSTSGKSKNIQTAMAAANELGVNVVLWMGNFDYDDNSVDVWKVPSTQTPRIQEIHLTWGHILAESIEILISSV